MVSAFIAVLSLGVAILAFLGFVTVRLGRMAPRPTHLQTPTDGERVERGERQLIHV